MKPTEAEKETIKRLWQRGDSSSSIAAAIERERGHRNVGEGVTRNVIIGVIGRARKKGEKVDGVLLRISDGQGFQSGARVRKMKAAREKPTTPKVRKPPLPSSKPEFEKVQPGKPIHLYIAPGQINVPFMDRKFAQCAWPTWDDTQKVGPVCGLPTMPEASYCEFHSRVGTTGHYASQPYRIR